MTSNLGVGIGYRAPLHTFILSHAEWIDWLEFNAEEFMPLSAARMKLLDDLGDKFRIVPHFTELSIAGPGGPNPQHLDQVVALAKHCASPWVSDHFCYTRTEGAAFDTLLPPPWDAHRVKLATSNIQTVQNVTGLPIAVENIAWTLQVGSLKAEAAALCEVLEATNASLLLDLHNLYCNSRNFNGDAGDLLRCFPLPRLCEVHLAGGQELGGFQLDSHDARVPDAVWDLLSQTCELASVTSVLLERDAAFENAEDDLLSDIERARAIIQAG